MAICAPIPLRKAKSFGISTPFAIMKRLIMYVPPAGRSTVRELLSSAGCCLSIQDMRGSAAYPATFFWRSRWMVSSHDQSAADCTDEADGRMGLNHLSDRVIRGYNGLPFGKCITYE